MPVLRCYVSEEDEKTLIAEAQRTGRQVDELAEAAISNACSEARVASVNLRMGRDERGTPIGPDHHARAMPV